MAGVAWPPAHHQVDGGGSLTMLEQTHEPITLRWYLDVVRERWRVVIASTTWVSLAVLFLHSRPSRSPPAPW